MGPDRPSASLAGCCLDGIIQLATAVASGASGTVYRGWHARAGAVAVKISHADDDHAVLRAMREANAAAALDEPHVVRVIAAGRLADGRAWVAMEWIDGVTLEDALAGRPWPLPRVLGVAAQLARALAAAHAAAIVHRDLKPANVMLRRGSDRVVVVDFGIARRAGDPASSASRCAGTPHYMPPEQALGEDVDATADLYALGCVLVKMLTGRVPFDGSSVEVLLAHLGQPPPALVGVPPAVAALVGRLLAKRPAERPQHAAAVAAELEALAAAAARVAAPAEIDPFDATVPVTTWAVAPLAPPAVAAKAARRARPRRVMLGALVMMALAVGVGAFSAVRALHVATATAAAGRVGAAGGVGAMVPRPDGDVAPVPVPPPVAPVMVVVDGGFAMRATLHAAPVAGAELALDLEIWDEDDQPIAATQVAATVRAPGGKAVAVGVEGKAGVFRLRQRTRDAGTHVVTVFAPSGETTFTLRVEVAARPAA